MSVYEIKQVICVRKDLNMRKGKIAAQVAHASMKFMFDCSACERLPRNEWLPIEKLWFQNGFAKIVVSVDSLEELSIIESRAKQAGLVACRIIDSGATEFHGIPTVTCCAVGPAKAKDLDDITGHLKLL